MTIQRQLWVGLTAALVWMIGNAGGDNTAIAQSANTIQTLENQLLSQEQGNQLCPDELESTLDQIVDNSRFSSAQWGILVEALDSDTILYSRNPDAYLIPASNIKLLTTAAALQVSSDQDLASLGSWIRVINQDSNNRYADALLNQIGGAEVVKDALLPLGVDPDSYRQVDGSGLSRYNMAKPSTFVTLLQAMPEAHGSDVFLSSLAIAGVNGTLKNRFHGTPAEGIVHAKTGTLTGVRALSGYLDHPDYGPLVFSIMVNQRNQSGPTLVQAIDQIVVQLAQVTPCD